MLQNLPPLVPLVPWKQCELDSEAQTGLLSLLDPYHKRFASHWLWEAQHNRDELQSNPNFPHQFRPQDKEQLERDFSLIIQDYTEYKNCVRRKKKKDAREFALRIKRSAEVFMGLSRASSTTALLNAQAKENSEPTGWDSILDEVDPDATILVSGKRRALQCSVGYRHDAFYALIDWLDTCFTDCPQKRVFWLHGKNNCGKSVIAHYTATQLNERGALAAGYVFHDDFSEAKLSGLIANFIDEFMDHIGTAFLQRQLWDVLRNLRISLEKFRKLPVASQFEKLLAPAWKSLDWEHQKPMVVVLDDLDRCDQSAIFHVVDLIQTSISSRWGLPIYWIVSSCATPEIESRMKNTLGDTVLGYELPVYDPTQDPVTPLYRPPTPPTPTDAQSFVTAWEPPDTPKQDKFFANSEGSDDEILELKDRIQICSIQGALLAPDKAMNRDK